MLTPHFSCWCIEVMVEFCWNKETGLLLTSAETRFMGWFQPCALTLFRDGMFYKCIPPKNIPLKKTCLFGTMRSLLRFRHFKSILAMEDVELLPALVTLPPDFTNKFVQMWKMSKTISKFGPLNSTWFLPILELRSVQRPKIFIHSFSS